MTQPFVYLHVGLHKTGTTSIQKFFLDNQKKFLHQGFLYPKAGLPGAWYGHHDLAWSINQDSRLVAKNTWEELNAEISSAAPKSVVISSECFNENFSSNEINKLRNKLRPYQTKIVIYLRRQDFWFQSYYIQAVKDGQTYRHFIPFAEQMREKNLGNYDRLLSLWASYFGEENLIVSIFQEKKAPEKLIRDFLNLIRAPDDLSNSLLPERLNISLNVKCVKVIRFINSIARFLPYPQKKKAYLERLGDRKGLLYQIMTQIPDQVLNDQLASPEQLNSLMKHFEKSNQAVAQKYLGANSLF